MSMTETAVSPPRALVELARDMARRDDYTNFGFIAADWVTIVGIAALAHVGQNLALDALAALVIGSRMRALANLMHEASHYKLFRSRRLNAIAGRVLCAWPIAESLGVYTREHHLHHRTLWRSEVDPDRRLYRLTDTETASRPRMTFSHFAVHHVLLVVLLWHPGRRLLQDRRSLGRGLAMGAGSIGLFVTSPAIGTVVFLYWALPWFTTYQVIGYWAELAEHGGLLERGWDWGSRNWSGHALTRWLIGSHSADLYHLAHHWFPAVPHWRLAQLDRACRKLWPAYAGEIRCDGFFVARSVQGTSVLRDIWSGGEPLARVRPVALDSTTILS